MKNMSTFISIASVAAPYSNLSTNIEALHGRAPGLSSQLEMLYPSELFKSEIAFANELDSLKSRNPPSRLSLMTQGSVQFENYKSQRSAKSNRVKFKVPSPQARIFSVHSDLAFKFSAEKIIADRGEKQMSNVLSRTITNDNSRLLSERIHPSIPVPTSLTYRNLASFDEIDDWLGDPLAILNEKPNMRNRRKDMMKSPILLPPLSDELPKKVGKNKMYLDVIADNQFLHIY